MIAGLILAAGDGRGSAAPKQLAELRGRPLLEHAVAAMLAVPAIDPVVVVLGARADEIARAGRLSARAESVVCDRLGRRPVGVAALRRGGARRRRRGGRDARRPAADHAGGDRRRAAVRSAGTSRARDLRRAAGPPRAAARPAARARRRACRRRGFRDLLEGARVRRFECGELCDPVDVDTREALDGLRWAGPHRGRDRDPRDRRPSRRAAGADARHAGQGRSRARAAGSTGSRRASRTPTSTCTSRNGPARRRSPTISARPRSASTRAASSISWRGPRTCAFTA